MYIMPKPLSLILDQIKYLDVELLFVLAGVQETKTEKYQE